jgi:hypothetical protein
MKIILLNLFFWFSSIIALAQTLEFSPSILKPNIDEIKFVNSLSLSGSLNESLFTLLKFEKLSGCHEIKFIFPKDLAVETTFHHLNPITTKHPSFPKAKPGPYFDLLTPLANNKICSEHKYIILETKPSATTKPGLFQFEIDFANTKYKASIKIWKMKHPENSLLQMYSEYAPYGGVLGHFGKYDKGEEVLADRYFTVMKDFSIQPLNGWIALPQKDINENNFKTQWLGQFNKSKYAQLPGRYDTIKQKDWDLFYSFLGKEYAKLDKDKVYYIYLADEPKKEEIPKVIEAAKLVRKHLPKAKILVTTDYQKALDPYVDIFVVLANQWQNQNKKYPKKEFWLYVSCMSHGCDALADLNNPDFVVERPSSYIRSLAWIMNRKDIDKFLYYQLNYQYQFYPKIDPIKDIWAFSGNGDGTLVYPGRPGFAGLTEHQPLLSLRMLIWKQAVYDFQYLKWMNQKSSASNLYKSIKREIDSLNLEMNRFPIDTKVYENLRLKVGEYLNGQ